MLLAHNIFSFAVAYTLMSWIEYAVHRWMLHTKTVVNVFPADEFKRRFNDHAVSHHSRFYKCFRKEEDAIGKHVGMLIPWSFYKYIAIIAGLLLLVDPLTAVYFVAAIIAHYLVWNKFHEVMHFDTNPWYVRAPLVGHWFRFVEYYHFLHHQHRSKNFNAFLPMWDWILGTSADETELDRKVWSLVNMGEFVDRRGVPMIETAQLCTEQQASGRRG